MSVATGTATSNIDLLQKLVAWLVTRGWTSNMSQADGSGWRAHLSKGGVYLNFRASVAGDQTWDHNYYPSGTYNYALHLYVGTGYSAGSGFKDQAGGPVESGSSSTVGVAVVTGSGAITSYQFIDDASNNVAVLIERSPGVFRHLAWGTLSKYGSWTGGVYFCGSTAGYYAATTIDLGTYSAFAPMASAGVQNSGHAGFLRADVDTFTGKWLAMGEGTATLGGYTGKLGTSGIQGGAIPSSDVPLATALLWPKLHTTMDGRAITLPILLYGARDAGGYSALGEVPGIRLCRVSEIGGVSVGSDVPIGSDTWRVFPGFLVKV